MSQTITLYTPGTGLPDFEMRIALGLCAAALNAFAPEKVCLYQEAERYVIAIEDEQVQEKLKNSLAWLCANRIGRPEALMQISGFYKAKVHPSTEGAKVKSEGYAKKIAKFANLIRQSNPEKLFAITTAMNKPLRRTFKSCGHIHAPKTKIFDAIFPLSPEIGKIPIPRGTTKRKNLAVCSLCGVLAVLGAYSFQLHLSVPPKGKNRPELIFAFLPKFSKEIPGPALARFLSATKYVERRITELPAVASGLVLLAGYPHLVEALTIHHVSLEGFSVSVAERLGNRAPRFVARFEEDCSMPVSFLQYSVRNRALVQRMLRDRTFENSRVNILITLSRALRNSDSTALVDFARSYVVATKSQDGQLPIWALVPEPTAEFFAKEVIEMDKKLLEPERFDTISDFARMLKFFVARRNFGPVDNLRKARDTDEFMEIICNAQREVESIATLKEKERNKALAHLDISPYLLFVPTVNKVQHLLQIVTEQEGRNFKSVQTLIALLAFTYYRKEGA